MAKLKKTTLHIQGMHCPSCDVLISDKFKEVGNVKEVKADYSKQTAEVCYVGRLEKQELNNKISSFGYKIVDQQDLKSQSESLMKRLGDAGTIAIILFILYFFASELNLLPSFGVGSSLSFTGVFVLGLIASTSTCMATSGALFLATVGKLTDNNSKIILAISFNLGRVLSYGFFGYLFGLLGKTIALNLQLGSYLTLFVAIFMLFIGLDMLHLLPFPAIYNLSFFKNIFLALETRLIKNPKKTAFLLGAITYLLPCGFTQTVQLYALGLADPVKSALIMMIFALGTVPALMAIGFASSFTRSRYYPIFTKVVGVLLVTFGAYYFSNFLSLNGVNIKVLSVFTSQSKNIQSIVPIKDGYQIANMSVSARGYSPNSFVVKKGIPVKWIVNGENVFGCQGYLVARTLGVQKILKVGENVIEFTPEAVGPIYFSCAMGMFRGAFDVVKG